MDNIRVDGPHAHHQDGETYDLYYVHKIGFQLMVVPVAVGADPRINELIARGKLTFVTPLDEEVQKLLDKNGVTMTRFPSPLSRHRDHYIFSKEGYSDHFESCTFPRQPDITQEKLSKWFSLGSKRPE